MWKRRIFSAFILVPVIAFTGCMNTARIKSDKGEVGGIPFFTKRAIYRQTSVYDVRWVNVTLEITPAKADPSAKDAPKSTTLSARARTDSPS